MRANTAVFALGLLALGLGGCKVTAEDIEYWKGTVKGPGKIVSVMLADKYDLQLRTQAALALVDMERQDIDGTAELQKAVQRLDPETRSAIIETMVPGLRALMKQADPKASGPAPRQIRAKDAAFLLITHAPPAVRTKLTEDVVNWYVEDFNGRSLAGNYSAEQVVRALGSSAAKVLVTGLKARLPQEALVKMAQLISQLASGDARANAGKRLVAIEREMESDEFLKWLQDGVRKQLADGGAKVDEKRVVKAALLNREKFINDGAMPAMKWLADEAEVKARLLEVASTDTKGAAATERRVRALMALEGKVGKPDLPKVLALALNESNSMRLRDYAFDRIGDIRSPEALPKLWPLVQTSDKEKQRLRWRAGELVLAIGGSSVVGEFFAKLPPDGSAGYAAEELEGYATRMGQMAPLPTTSIRGQLKSPNWWNRVVALRFFERKGGKDDLKRMKSLTGDGAKVKGPRWGKLKTVGAVAKEAHQSAEDRLKGKGK